MYLDLEGDAAELQDRLASSPGHADEVELAVETVEVVARPGRVGRGQGRGLSGPERKAVELRAMEVVARVLALDHWSVEDVSRQRSYDLHCTRGEEELRVEVKGTTGAGERILLTRNEVSHANEHEGGVALFVVSRIDLDRDARPPRATGGQLRRLEPWALSAGTLEPVGYEWVLPTGE
jgi:hypothetical protein